jgi:hypothetical protein
MISCRYEHVMNFCFRIHSRFSKALTMTKKILNTKEQMKKILNCDFMTVFTTPVNV